MVNLRDTVASTMITRKLLPASGALVVGVSGGTDSLALMHVLANLREKLALHLHIATLDHGLRGEEGAADVRFVIETAQAWSLSVTAGHADVRTMSAEDGIGIEAAARRARYGFLASVAHEIGATHIAVAHNADDQVETVLLHLLRGTGLPGLAGMRFSAPLPDHPDLTLLRPLLNVSRADLEAYCREQGLQPRQDASNEDISYRRNRLRHEVMPALRQVSAQIKRNLTQLAAIVREEDDFIDFALHEAIDAHVIREEGRISLPNNLFFSLHPTLQKRFILWAARWCDPASEASYERVNAALTMTLRGKVGARTEFRSGVQLRLDYDAVIVEKQSAPHVENLPLLSGKFEISVDFPGSTRINGAWMLEAALAPLEGESARLAISDRASVRLRARRSGDFFAPFGLAGHTQKLTEWMIDHKIPRDLRARIPLLVINGEIAAVWWHGWIVGERFAVRDNSPRIVYFRFASGAN